MSTINDVTVATSQAFSLAEGPRWDGARERLLWVDIARGAVLAGRIEGLVIRVTDQWEVGGTVGAVAFRDDKSLLVAGSTRLMAMQSDGATEPGPRIIDEHAARRLNDGAVDPSGRFLVGTLSLAGPSSSETLVRLEADGSLTTLDDDLTMSNGLAWSVDGDVLYSVDTLRGMVYTRPYDASGAVGPRRPHLHLEHESPDGIAVDADDHLWIAVWGQGEIRRFTPHGELVAVVRVPAPHVTAVSFAGPDLRTLVITTAADELTDAQRARFPQSGRLFTVRVDAPGLPVTPWAGLAAR